MNHDENSLVGVLEHFGRRYVEEFLVANGWEPERLRADWYFALKFLLWRLYFQGRRDEISERFCRAMTSCLDKQFLSEPTAQFEQLADRGAIPTATGWWDVRDLDRGPLWQKFDRTMGKGRDREMVLDVLRYIRGLPGHNIVTHTLGEIEAGRIHDHRQQLMELRGVGEKTSAFYLRDVIFLFDIRLAPDQLREIQPVDTWVRQLVAAVVGPDADPAEWLAAQAQAGYNAGLLNAGAWYLGKHSFQLLVSLLASGELEPAVLERMQREVAHG